MTRPKFRLLVVGLGAGAMLALVAPGADTPAAPAKPPLTAKPAWVPLFDYDALDVKPVPIEQAAPAYPPALKAAGVKAKVSVEFIIGKDGTVEAAQILKTTDPRFNDTCVAAAMKWRFTIPKKKGAPAYCRASQHLSFD